MRSYSPISHLSPEVFDEILGHLHDDHESLKSCSLTCRAWLPTTRVFLFRKIALSESNYESFEDILKNSSGIAKCVRELAISVFKTKTCLVLPKLPSVRKLTLHSWIADDIERDVCEALHASFTKLNTLILERVQFMSSTGVDILRNIQLCPKLRCLHIKQISFPPAYLTSLKPPCSPTPVPVPPSDSNALEELSVVLCPESTIEWLQSVPSFRQPRRLNLIWVAPTETEHVQAYLNNAGSCLDQLVLSYMGEYPEIEDVEVTSPIALSTAKNIQLRGLCLKLCSISEFEIPLIQHDWTVGVLSSLRSPVLSLISFIILVSAVCQIDELRWTELDDSIARLAQDRPDLQVRFEVRSPDYHMLSLPFVVRGIGEMIREHMCKSQAEGVQLQIVTIGGQRDQHVRIM